MENFKISSILSEFEVNNGNQGKICSEFVIYYKKEILKIFKMTSNRTM